MGEDLLAGEEPGAGLLAISYSLPECQAVRAMLLAYGIPSIVHGWHAVSSMPRIIVALGGFRILVPAIHMSDARALLTEAEPWVRDLTADWRKFHLLDAVVTLLLFLMIGFVPPPPVELDYGSRGRVALAGGGQAAA